MKPIKRSVIVICNTPFDAEGALDEAAYRRQLGRLRDGGVAVYVAGSASGEAFTFSAAELDRVLSISVEELKGRASVNAMGCEPRTHREMIAFLKSAERAQVDSAQICSLDMGHGAKPTNAELDYYYRTVVEATSVPIRLSSHRTAGYFLPLDLIEKLVSDYPSIVGVAYGGPDTHYLAQLIRRVGDRVEVHCAGPGNALSVLGLGGNGFMGGEGNLSPEMVQSVIRAYDAGDMSAAQANFDRLMAFVSIYGRFGGSSMRGMKPLMNAYGLPGGHLRAPRLPVGKAELDEMIRLVAPLNLPGISLLETASA